MTENLRPRPITVGIPELLADRLRYHIPHTAMPIILADEGPLSPSAADIEFFVPMFNRPRVSELLPQLQSLRVLQTMSAGVDWLLAMAPPGVTICDASGVHDIPVAEWILTAILSMCKQFPVFRDRQRSGVWQRPSMLQPDIADLAGKNVLIIGFGSIGRATEERLAPFRVEIVRVARRPRDGVFGMQRLPELLPQADIVVLLLPLTDETRGIVDAKFLNGMKKGALLVNAARGALVHTSALVDFLHAGHIKAALDVTEPEPLSEGHALWTAPNTLITPHTAGHSPEFLDRAGSFVGGQVERFGLGMPLKNVVENGY
jgi:phosphoglycerate dehydrogenase-like enzyme